MEIQSSFVNSLGERVDVHYQDVDMLDELEGRTVSGVHAYCFLGDKLVIVYAETKNMWTPPGGGVEHGETVEAAVSREVAEEANMRVIQQALIGFQDISHPSGVITQTRSVCIVEPIEEFVSDPDNDVTEIKLIDPVDYKSYFDWGVVGDHIIKRAALLRETLG